MKLTAGRPVVILHNKFADKSSIHPNERVKIITKKRKITAIVDTATGFLDKDEVVISNEVSDYLRLKKGDKVEIRMAGKPESLKYIYKKLNGEKLEKKELEKIMKDIVANNLTEAEVAYFISGVYNKGMTIKETADMTRAIVDSGEKIKIKGKVVDKHSIGGVPGRLSPLVISICCAAGLIMPKTSSRAITTPSGTADAMETLCEVEFSIPDIKKILQKNNGFLVWGGSLNLAPADDKIIQVEKLLNLDPTPQLLSSIMAKKLAVSANHVFISIPYGKYAKVDKKEGKQLKNKFLKLGKLFGIKLVCKLTKVEEPYGNGIGPALEMIDVLKVFNGEKSYQLRQRAVKMSGIILEMSGKAKKGQGSKMAREILDSGKAFDKFKEIILSQKGELKNFEKIKQVEKSEFKKDIVSKKNGKIKEINIREINYLARVAGCPLDKYAGLYLYKHVNDKVKKGEKLISIYAESKAELNEAVKYFNKSEIIKFK